MSLEIATTAIIVGVIAYGLGKLSVYSQLESERDLTQPFDPALYWEPRQFELWSKAQEHEVAAERETAKLIPTISLASIAGVAALAQLNVIGTTGVILLSLGFFLPIVLCTANMQMRQSLFNERSFRLQRAFELGRPMQSRPYDDIKRRIVAGLPKVGAIMFSVALLVTTLALSANGTDCTSPFSRSYFDEVLCANIIQALGK